MLIPIPNRWIFLGATHVSRLGLHRHSRESGNPEAGQRGRHNTMIKMNDQHPWERRHLAGFPLFYPSCTE